MIAAESDSTPEYLSEYRGLGSPLETPVEWAQPGSLYCHLPADRSDAAFGNPWNAGRKASSVAPLVLARLSSFRLSSWPLSGTSTDSACPCPPASASAPVAVSAVVPPACPPSASAPVALSSAVPLPVCWCGIVPKLYLALCPHGM